MKIYILIAAYGTVLFAELLGDKSLFTIGTLATRFHSVPVLCGITAAFMSKVLAAVLLGRAIAQLPAAPVAALSAAAFFATAAAIWFKKPRQSPGPPDHPHWSWAVAVSFAAIFFSEWADAGQITTATLAARYQAPVAVWLGASSALATKGLLAVTLGIKLKRFIPRIYLRAGAVGMCLVLGVLAALEIRS